MFRVNFWCLKPADERPAKIHAQEPEQFAFLLSLAIFITWVSIASAEIGERRTSVNWTAAREDFSRQEMQSFNISPEIKDSIKRSPIPVLLPASLAQALVVEVGTPTRLKVLDDGYTAVKQNPEYDVLVEGTNQVLDIGQEIPETVAPAFSTEEGGGISISFRNYGASYKVEVICNNPKPEPELCFQPDAAMKIAPGMVIVGGSGM